MLYVSIVRLLVLKCGNRSLFSSPPCARISSRRTSHTPAPPPCFALSYSYCKTSLDLLLHYYCQESGTRFSLTGRFGVIGVVLYVSVCVRAGHVCVSSSPQAHSRMISDLCRCHGRVTRRCSRGARSADASGTSRAPPSGGACCCHVRVTRRCSRGARSVDASGTSRTPPSGCAYR